MNEHSIRLIFGLKLRELRANKNLTLAELAKRTGLSPSYLNELEKGKKYPKQNKIMLLAEALDSSYDYLVSLQLSKKLTPLADLLQSNILQELPLTMLGVEFSDLVDLLSNAPAKLSAFISTLAEISRMYDMRVEHFYFSVLRSLQELNENYFEEIEKSVANFRKELELDEQFAFTKPILEKVLRENFNYTIDYESLEKEPQLSRLRSIMLPAKKARLLLNPKLSEAQQAFALGRELGYQVLELKERSYTTSWVEVDNFEQVLNNFKASYFSCALLIPEKTFTADLDSWMKQEHWDPNSLLRWMDTYQATPEVIMHRLTNLLPKHFGLKELFFLRFSHPAGSSEYSLEKELHLSGLHNPHATLLNEHYCRRWISLTVLDKLDQHAKPEVYCRAQRSRYFGSENEYLIICLTRPHSPQQGLHSSLSIGLRITEQLKDKVGWWEDNRIPLRWVNETCERCPAVDCQERAAPPTVLQQLNRGNEMKFALQDLRQRYL